MTELPKEQERVLEVDLQLNWLEDGATHKTIEVKKTFHNLPMVFVLAARGPSVDTAITDTTVFVLERTTITRSVLADGTSTPEQYSASYRECKIEVLA